MDGGGGDGAAVSVVAVVEADFGLEDVAWGRVVGRRWVVEVYAGVWVHMVKRRWHG